MLARLSSLSRSLLSRSERHGEKLIDAGLLVAALNAGKAVAFLPIISWPAQAAILVAFVLIASSGGDPNAGLWRRYARLLPGYVATALTGVFAVGWWFSLPRSDGWFAPLWIGLTLLLRLARLPGRGKLLKAVLQRRLDIVAGEVMLLTWFSFVVPRWSLQPGPAWTAVGGLGLGWILVHSLFPLHAGSLRRPRIAALGGAMILAGGWALVSLVLEGAQTIPALVLAAWLAVGLGLYRLAAQRWASDAVSGPPEILRWLGLFGAAAYFFAPFARAGVHGAGDALYYATFLSDALAQFRHGIFPVFVGQSEYQFNGSVMPIRVAPGFQYLGGLLDCLTARTLGTLAVQNLLVTCTGVVGIVFTYASLLRLKCQPNQAAALTLLYLTCPGSLGLAFNSDLYMSWLTFPLVTPVFVLSFLSYREPTRAVFALLGFSLGLTWWLHPPVALWITMIAASLQVARLIALRPPLGRAAVEIAIGASCFLAIVCYPVISTVGYPADPGMGSSTALSQGAAPHPAPFVLQQLQETFPAAWLPLSLQGRRLTDYQLGYGLLAIGCLAAAGWRLRRTEIRVLLVLSALLLLMLVPIPWLCLHLWQLVPKTVLDLTNVWVMQRLYLILAGMLVVGVAAYWSAAAPGRFARLVLIFACGWSTVEALKFVRGSWAATSEASFTPTALLPSNITLTRYSYGLFAQKPSYFTHGVTDPYLENRFLEGDLRTTAGGNPSAVLQMTREGNRTEHVFRLSDGRLSLVPALKLVPGRRYVAELDPPSGEFPAATLVIQGTSLRRVYGLPEYGEPRSFGIGGAHATFFPLHTSAGETETLEIVLVPSDLGLTPSLDGRVKLHLGSYEPSALPVRVQSWMPFTASVRSSASAWLETPRMYQQGYIAQVNGRPAEARRSVEGLVSVPVPPGESVVELRYGAPTGLQGAFWLSFAGLVAGAAVTLFAGARILSAPPVAAAIPAATPR